MSSATAKVRWNAAAMPMAVSSAVSSGRRKMTATNETGQQGEADREAERLIQCDRNGEGRPGAEASPGGAPVDRALLRERSLADLLADHDQRQRDDAEPVPGRKESGSRPVGAGVVPLLRLEENIKAERREHRARDHVAVAPKSLPHGHGIAIHVLAWQGKSRGPSFETPHAGRLYLTCVISVHRGCPAIGAAQHGHRGRYLTSSAIRRRRMVAIEFGMCRSGRNGGTSGSITGGNGRLREEHGGGRS